MRLCSPSGVSCFVCLVFLAIQFKANCMKMPERKGRKKGLPCAGKLPRELRGQGHGETARVASRT